MISSSSTRPALEYVVNMNRELAGSKMPKMSSSCGSDIMEERRFASILRSCHSCGHEIDCNTDMIGMPAGVKFDPSDQELIHHLQSMVDDLGSRAHPLIDQFIPTIQGEGGINIHPENLPGVRKDGLSKYFFHRSSKAYPTGTRKSRTIHALDLNRSDNVTTMRWHKTGKTRPVIVGGQQKGCKKILVLNINFGKHQKPEKTNWVIHQYHLGDQDEKDGELIVSKLFYQTQMRQQVDAAVVKSAEQHMTMDGDKAAKTSDVMQQGVVSHCSVATATWRTVMMQKQQQQQQMNKAVDGQISVTHSKKRRLEVGEYDQEISDRGQQDDNQNLSQHQACRELQRSPRDDVFTNTSLLNATKREMDSTAVSTDRAGPMISNSSKLTDGKLEEHQASTLRSCPSCGHEIDCNTDMIGMPVGVKFDPSDQELIDHLHAMVDEGGSRSHPLIDQFIPTIQGEDGINIYPENLPGVRRDGTTKYFFHKSSNAYTNSTRKRRKILAQRDSGMDMSWHKTGKTQPVIVRGQQKGCKKIMVLYTNIGKHMKPAKTNWVMHQYHLGDQEEKDGELVVSKVFYQTQTRQHMDAAVAANVEQHEVGVCDQGSSDTRTTGLSSQCMASSGSLNAV